MGYPRQEYWSGQTVPSQGIFLTQGWNQVSALQADSLLPEPPGKPRRADSFFKIGDTFSLSPHWCSSLALLFGSACNYDIFKRNLGATWNTLRGNGGVL